MARSWQWGPFLFVPFLTTGCFLGYDSSWAQQRQAQQHAVQRSTPQQLPAFQPGATRTAQRVLKVRVYASPDYVASVVDWQKQFGVLVERVNAVLTAEFGAALEVVDVRTFSVQASGEKLEAPLQQLVVLDPASDVDWVVGLVAATPRFAVSADDLGRALMPGRHIVMRGMSDPQEYEAIERVFTNLSEEERHKLYRVRKEHKLATTFLHELAHTLGVPHELQATSLMNSRYHVEANDFSDEAAEIIRAALASRISPESPVLDAALATKLEATLRATDAGWEPMSRDAELQVTAKLLGHPAVEVSTSPSSTSPQAVAARPSVAIANVEGLSPEEQRTFAAARAELNAGNASHARQISAALFTKYPKLPDVQALRCETAMAIGGDWDTISAECPGLSPLGNK